MATPIDSEQFENFLNALNDITRQLSGTGTTLDKSFGTIKTAEDLFKRQSESFNNALKSSGQAWDESTKKAISLREKELSLLNETQKVEYKRIENEQKQVLLDIERNKAFKDELKSLGFKLATDGQYVKSTTLLTKEQQDQINLLKKIKNEEEERSKAWSKFVNSDLSNLGKSFGTLASGAVLGETSFKSLTPIVDAVGNALGSLAKTIPFFGGFFEGTIKATTEASKILLQLLDKNVKGFQEIATAGGLVGDGMTGLGRQFLASGMTFDGFIKTVKSNGAALASFGGTVGLGAEKFSEAVGMLTKDSENELRKLGLTADNIGEAAAGFLNMEMRLGRTRQMDAVALAKGTKEYVKELDLLSKVTGLSREDAQKQRDEMLTDSRYSAARAQMTESGAKAMDTFIMTLKDPELKRGVMDLASGNVSTAAAAKTIQALGPEALDMVEKLKDAKPETMGKVFNEVQKMYQQSAKAFVEQYGDVAQILDPSVLGNFSTFFEAAYKKLPDYEEAQKIQKQQIKATDDLTEKTVDAQKQMELFSQNMFEIAQELLPFAANAVKKFGEGMVTITNKIKELLGDKTPTTKKDLPTPAQAREQRISAQDKVKTAEEDLNKSQKANAPQEEINEKRIALENARRQARIATMGEMSVHGRRQPRSWREVLGSKKGSTGSTTESPESAQIKLEDLFVFDSSGLGTGDKTHFEGLDEGFKQNIIQAAQEYYDLTGKKITVNSAKRSLEEQKKLKRKLGPLAAEPGSSAHEIGKAVDLRAPDQHLLAEILLKMGINRPLSNEDWHFQGASRGGRFNGPISGYPVLLHGPETVLNEPQTSALEKILSQVMKKEIDVPGSMSTTPDNSIREILDFQANLMTTLTNKLTDLEDKLAKSNDIQQNILNYSI